MWVCAKLAGASQFIKSIGSNGLGKITVVQLFKVQSKTVHLECGLLRKSPDPRMLREASWPSQTRFDWLYSIGTDIADSSEVYPASVEKA